MDVPLSSPELVSIDSLLALLGLGFAGLGAYRVFTEVGTVAGLEGWVLLAVGFVFLFPRLFLTLRLGDDAVEVGIITGTRRVPYEEIQTARRVDGKLAMRLGGTGASGYHTGLFRLTGEGQVKAYTSCTRGPFVLLERANDPPFVVSPSDPDAFLAALQTRRAAG